MGAVDKRARYRAKQSRRGLTQVCVWARVEDKGAIQAFAASLRTGNVVSDFSALADFGDLQTWASTADFSDWGGLADWPDDWQRLADAGDFSRLVE